MGNLCIENKVIAVALHCDAPKFLKEITLVEIYCKYIFISINCLASIHKNYHR